MGSEIDPLDGLLESAKVEAGLPTGQAIAKTRYTHDAMVDLIIANPSISQNALAAAFGYTASWVSRVIASDAFQSKLAERTKELVDPTVRSTIEERFRALVLRSLEILSDKLDRPSDKIPDQLALQTLNIASRAAGFGAKEAPAPASPSQVNEHLAMMGVGLVELLRKKKVEASIPGEFTEVANG